MTLFLFYKSMDYIPIWSIMVAEEFIEQRALTPREEKVKRDFRETAYRVDCFDTMLRIVKSMQCLYVTNHIDRIVLKVNFMED